MSEQLPQPEIPDSIPNNYAVQERPDGLLVAEPRMNHAYEEHPHATQESSEPEPEEHVKTRGIAYTETELDGKPFIIAERPGSKSSETEQSREADQHMEDDIDENEPEPYDADEDLDNEDYAAEGDEEFDEVGFVSGWQMLKNHARKIFNKAEEYANSGGEKHKRAAAAVLGAFVTAHAAAITFAEEVKDPYGGISDGSDGEKQQQEPEGKEPEEKESEGESEVAEAETEVVEAESTPQVSDSETEDMPAPSDDKESSKRVDDHEDEDDLLSRIPDTQRERIKFEKENFAGPFDPGKVPLLAAFLQKELTSLAARVPEGSKYADTVAAVVGNGGDAWRYLNGLYGVREKTPLSANEFSALPFSEVAKLVGLDVRKVVPDYEQRFRVR